MPWAFAIWVSLVLFSPGMARDGLLCRTPGPIFEPYRGEYVFLKTAFLNHRPVVQVRQPQLSLSGFQVLICAATVKITKVSDQVLKRSTRRL